MNEKFFTLPEEKQQTVLNAGYRVFSQNSYKKSPMSEIAEAAGISKSLLFHYFHNKKELYLFLWEKAGKLTTEYLTKFNSYEQQGLFEMMVRGLQAKIHLMKQYPYIAAFAIRAFYEKDPAVHNEIQASYRARVDFQRNSVLLDLSREQFIPGLDIRQMYEQMCWASEGYLWEKIQQGEIDADEMEQEFSQMIVFWKSIYLRKGEKGAD